MFAQLVSAFNIQNSALVFARNSLALDSQGARELAVLHNDVLVTERGDVPCQTPFELSLVETFPIRAHNILCADCAPQCAFLAS